MILVDTIKGYKCACGCKTVKVVSLEPLVVICEKCQELVNAKNITTLDSEQVN